MTWQPYRPPTRPRQRLPAGPLTYRSMVLADGAVAYWRLGEASGTTAVNESPAGSSIDGTYVNTPTLGEPGALAGDGDTAIAVASAAAEGLTVADADVLDLATNFTLEAWIKATTQTASTGRTIMSKYHGPGPGAWFFGLRNDGGLALGHNLTGTEEVNSGSALVQAGQWHHVVATYGTGAGTGKMYLDGVDVTASASGTTFGVNAGSLYIGHEEGGVPFDGALDEVALYARVLPAADIMRHYLVGRPHRRRALLDGAAFMAPLDEPSGSPTDRVGGLTGTVNGTLTYGHRAADELRGMGGFTSSSNYLTFPDDNALKVNNGPVTIAYWMARDTDTGGWQIVLNKGAGGYSSGIGPAGDTYSDRITLGNRGSYVIGHGTKTVPADGAWHHYVITRSGTGGTSTHRIYVDGVEDTWVVYSTGDTGTFSDTTDVLEIGREGAGSSLQGKVAGIGIWKRVLSPAEVLALYRAGRPYPAAVLGTNGLAMYWRLGEPSGTSAVDLAHGRNGTYTNSPTLGAAGLIRDDTDAGVQLDATAPAEYISLGSAGFPQGSAPRTVEAWVKTTASVTQAIIAYGAGAAGQAWWMRVASDGKLALSLYGTDLTFGAAGALNDGSPHHVVTLYDGANVRAYIDGAEASGSPSAQSPNTGTGTEWIGSDGTNNFTGTIDEVAVYSRALTAAEIRAHYQLGRQLSTLQNLVRTATDALATLSDAVARATAAWSRTSSDAVATISEAAVRAIGLARTAADSVATLTEAAARGTAAWARTVAQTLGATTEAVARGTVAWQRTVAQTLGAVSEAPVRIIGLARSVADSASTITEAAARGATAWVRSVPQALGSITEAVARAAANKARTAADTAGSLTEAVARAAANKARTAADSVATATDTVARLLGAQRAAGDTVGAISEAVARAATAFSRTVADSISAITEAVVAIKSGTGAYFATAADSVATLSEAVARGTASWARTASDTVASATDAVARQLTAARAAAQSLGAVSEAATRAAANKARTAAQSLGAVSEAATRAGTLARTAADAIASLVEAPARVAGLARTAADSVATLAETVVRSGMALILSGAIRWAGRGGSASSTGPTAGSASDASRGGSIEPSGPAGGSVEDG